MSELYDAQKAAEDRTRAEAAKLNEFTAFVNHLKALTVVTTSDNWGLWLSCSQCTDMIHLGDEPDIRKINRTARRHVRDNPPKKGEKT